jgi:dihydroflavonol-4-reductase
MAVVSTRADASAHLEVPRSQRTLRVLVTGGNGFIGSVVVRLLHAAGHQVRCLLRPTSNTARIDGLPVERAVGDVRDLDSLVPALEGRQAVIHLAGLSSWDLIDSPAMADTCEGGTANVLRAVRGIGPMRVIYVSSVLAVGSRSKAEPLDEATPYKLFAEKALTHSHHKYRAEELCRREAEAGQDVVIVNPAEVYGPNDVGLITAGNLIDFARSNPVLVCRGGTSIVHIEDVARGILAAVERGRSGERYILGGENITHHQLAELFLELSGQQKRILTAPNGLLRAVTRAARSVRCPLPYNYRVVPYATRYWFFDNSKARRELGVTFRTARETLAPTVAWLKGAGLIT